MLCHVESEHYVLRLGRGFMLVNRKPDRLGLIFQEVRVSYLFLV